jgi:phosphate transport system protein
MTRRHWRRPQDARPKGRDATVAEVIEAIDRTAPQTKADIAETVGISEQYLSEVLQELKTDEIVRKAYIVDDAAVYDSAGTVSPLTTETTDGPATDAADRGATARHLLERLDEVTTRQYRAARAAFEGDEPDPPADALESVANERYEAVVAELKSYTITTDWPGNRVASNLVTLATNLEIVGDRACFIADAVDGSAADGPGVVNERAVDVFDAGLTINELLYEVLFEAEVAAFERLRSVEESVHSDLNELFELVTAYSPELYGYLVSVTRALERAIYYWVDAAEIAARLHSGIRPAHTLF